MAIQKIREQIKESEEYAFLRSEPLASQLILLGLGGSYAYGTNVEGSDVDIRGIATHSARDILTGKGFEQITDERTDTVIYSLRKIVNLLENCNPNTIEMLGLEPWQYLKVTAAGKKLIENAHLFLSKRAVRSFGGYANAQLWRLKQKAIRGADQRDQEEHILNSIQSARYSFPEKYFDTPEDSIRLYTDKAVNEELETEIFMDLHLKHYPLRDYVSMWEEMKNIAKSYNRIGARNSKAIEHGRLTKHMMHLVRLYLMAFDILEEGKIVTYRRKEHDFLMDIRNGKFLKDEQPTEEFYDIVRGYEERLKTASEKSPLPANPDHEKIDRMVEEINLEVIEKSRRLDACE